MRPDALRTKIFLDGGDPEETKKAIDMLGFLDGQTTNPSLIAKNPTALSKRRSGTSFTKESVHAFYREVVSEIAFLIPDGSISIEVYADSRTSPREMTQQGEDMFSWIEHAHIKYPTTQAGLAAARDFVAGGMRVNMTLVFSQEQAAAVYAATKGAQKNDVYVSPFIGRLDDIGENGMDLVKNIMRMYAEGDAHVAVLVASLRSYEHFMYALHLEPDIITAPFRLLEEWAHKGLPMPEAAMTYDQGDLESIAYREINLSQQWESFGIEHELTAKGLQRFADDWNSLYAA